MNPYPHELQLGDVYFSPILAAVTLAFVATLLTVALLNRLRLAKWVYWPHYIFLAIFTLYMVAIDRFWIHF
ncbi:DUF1656 domain-containing protein [Hydrogenimonas sp.]